ncbi:type II toxin-antitoxin system VapC family toxin [Argonema antarcticum]|uniref:type II toxin-antitoxin system VapC family toxin n=1 Tax=Argonema antarcticum TaxID=2942763 RepID=UPI0020117EBC|nr:type II toxin-antitoxin system VapC family toxin [Argonema antarcticum]MCL1471121.1 type II toxin-antitoxin system VapC family toxin [Argonema antarcticum A004/B2]
MSGRFLLDTNIAIAFLEGDTSVEQLCVRAEAVFVSSTAIGELYYGAYKSGRVAENLARIEEFIATNNVLPSNTATANQYGQIRNLLRQKGRPIPDNDIWIAAVAMQHQLTLVSRDAHFQEVDGLVVEMW